jgi:hypothetical protein
MVGEFINSLGDGVSAVLVNALASPKSSTLTVPSGRTLMFAGFRSRWMTPASCAASSASAICLAMDDALLVRRFERVRDLPADRERIRDGERALNDAVGERLAVDQLHDQRPGARIFFEAINACNVRVIERGKCLGLAVESGQPFGIISDRRR